MYFMDNPGFDECSPHVAEVAMRGQGLSSATLYITTFEQHRQVNTTGFIQSMYQKDNGKYSCTISECVYFIQYW